jgi:acyl-CoA dehydrogenase
MNFDFSDDLKLLRAEAQRFLRERCPPRALRRILEGEATHDAPLWESIAGLGWAGAAIPEKFGGTGLGREALCILAEELGRSLAPVPFASSAYFATEALLAYGSDAQRRAYLPKLAAGALIGTFALAEGAGNPSAGMKTTFSGGRLHGEKVPVADGGIADFAVVAAEGLYLVDLAGPGISRRPLRTLDPIRNHACISFDGAPAEPLPGAPGWPAVKRLLDQAAVLFAFEQLGGAEACLEMARSYALQRHAFGRPIGSFQAIKHKLAEVYVAIELARSNAYYGAYAISTGSAELPLAAAAARLSATDAFHLAAKENIQTHGGMGVTWEMDCHLYYRRAKLLAVAIGSAPYWRDQTMDELRKKAA